MKDRALVLGGGGVAGIAWMTGLLLGLSEQGVELRDPDLILGTSAGAAVAAQLGSPLSLEELFRRQVDPALQTREITPDAQLLIRLLKAFPTMAGRSAREIGEWALQAPTVAEAERRAVIMQRLPTLAWPDRLLRLVAVDAESGETRIFDRSCGTALVDAVAASCAVPGVWPPVTLDGRRYMDGGVRCSDNADLARGYARIVVVSPMGARPDEVLAFPLKEQIAILESAGSRPYVIEPDEESKLAIGVNPLLPETRVPAAEAGRRQGLAMAGELARWWE